MKELIKSLREMASRIYLATNEVMLLRAANALTDAADQLELNRWRRFGDEQPGQGDVVHAFIAGGHAMVHFHADDVNQWCFGQKLFEAQPDDMWRPANLPVSSEKPERIK